MRRRTVRKARTIRKKVDIAFTASVKAMQSRRGSRAAYEKMEARGGFQTKITPGLIAFLTEVDTAYLATANSGIY
jgi:hypothetical protein